MNLLEIVMLVFIGLEFMNVLTLYFQPGSKKGNGIGVFTAWEKSKEDEEVHSLVRYLVYWVAGTKLIFIGLLIAIIILGSFKLQLVATGVMVLSILSFYWKLFPMIRKLDSKGQIEPKGYSKVLGVMIAVFVIVFATAFLLKFLGS